MTKLHMFKSDVLAALRASLVEAKKDDAEAKKKHRAALVVAFKEYKDKLRKVEAEITPRLKANLEELVEWFSKRGYGSDDKNLSALHVIVRFDPPPCPMLKATIIEQQIAEVEKDSRDKLVLIPPNQKMIHGDYLYQCVNYVMLRDQKKSVCD